MCFGLASIAQFLVWLVVICAVIALLRLLVAFVLPKLGLAAEVVSFIVSAVYILIWAIICIAAIYFIFDLIACLGPSLSMPRLR